MFVRTLLVIAEDPGDLTADRYVQEMHAQLLESFSQEIYPYTRLVERHHVRAEMMFAYQGGLDGDYTESENEQLCPGRGI